MSDLIVNSLSKVIDEITQVPNLGQAAYTGSVIVSYPDKPEKIFEVDKILDIDYQREPRTSYADIITVHLVINRADYAMYIQPNADILNFYLMAAPMGEDGSGLNVYKPTAKRKYKAILLEKGNPVIEGNGKTLPTREVLEQAGPITITLQLLELAVYEFMQVRIGMTIVDTTVENAIKAVLGKYCAMSKLPVQLAPQGVKMVPSDNKEVRDHVVIEHVVPLTDIPGYLQNKIGVYAKGMGYYYHSNYWHIWPMLDLNRFSQSQEKLHVINVPTNRLTGAERTFRDKDGITTILSTGDVKFGDPSEAFQLNIGNATVFGNSNSLIDKPVTVSGNKIKVNGDKNVNIFSNNDRRDKNNNIALSDTRLNDNVFLESSKMAIRDGVIVSVTWNNARPALALPHKPVRFSYYDGKNVRNLYGVILKVQSMVTLVGKGPEAKGHNATCILTLFLERPEKDQGV